MSPNAAWHAWKGRLEALYSYRPYRPDELQGHVDAFILALRNAVRAEVEAVLAERDAAAKGKP